MKQNESANQVGEVNEAPAAPPPRAAAGSNEAVAQPYVYALGRVEPRFPQLSLEKEFLQAPGRKFAQAPGGSEIAVLTDRQTLYDFLHKPENRYLARQLCYVLTIEGVDTYILHPRDPEDLKLLVDAVRPAPRPTDVDCVIGERGPLASPEMCGGLMVPILAFDQMYSFDVDTLIKSILPQEKIAAKAFAQSAEELFFRVVQTADNAGATDEHRALNYCAVRYKTVYERVAQEHRENRSLSGVEVRPSRLRGARNVVDVIFSYTHRTTAVTEKCFCRVDVTEEFPFLVTPMSPYYDR